MFGRQFLQVDPYQASQRSIALDRDLANLLDEIVIETEGDIHVPIIRETLIMGNVIFAS